MAPTTETAVVRVLGFGQSTRCCAGYTNTDGSSTRFAGKPARKILVGQYEVRYEIQKSIIYVLRLWHTRESR